MRNMRDGHGKFGALPLLVALVAGVALVLLARSLLSSSDSATAIPQLEVAKTDAEWKALIANAVKYREDPLASWPEPVTPAGVQLVRSCADVPATATQTQMSIAYSPDETRRRVTFAYFEPPNGNYQLVLYSDGRTDGCTPRVVEVVKGPDTYKESVDRHICAEMTRMAGGLERTDETLRAASPDVARAYLQAFCQ